MKNLNKNRTENTVFNGIRNSLCFLLAAGMMACNRGGVDDQAVVGTISEEPVVDTWDANQFNTTFASTNNYEDWDLNDDNLLDENEYHSGFYNTWDVNKDNRLDENEWDTAVASYGFENETWSEWDTSGDGVLDENEFRTGFGDSNYYADWDMDKDNMLNEREYTDGIFGLWDENDDQVLDSNEYADYNNYYRG